MHADWSIAPVYCVYYMNPLFHILECHILLPRQHIRMLSIERVEMFSGEIEESEKADSCRELNPEHLACTNQFSATEL